MKSLLRAASSTWRAIAADHASMQRYRGKYHQETISTWRMPADLVRKVGFQMLVAVRVMQGLRDARVPLGPQIVSRLIRHAYGAEIHWDAKIAPGISFVHGNGLVISHKASVSPGCILFQNVTLGEGIDPETRTTGAPHLEEDVHVGPGACLLGPITVGAESKIAAGSTLAQSVPRNSLVEPAAALVSQRKKRP